MITNIYREPKKYGYARISLSQRQLNAKGEVEGKQDIQRQINELEEEGIAKENILCDIGVSGKAKNKDSLDRLLGIHNYENSKPILQQGDYLYVTELSRLSRDSRLTSYLFQRIQDLKVNLILLNYKGMKLTNGENSDNDFMNEIFLKVLSFQAQKERELLIERTKSGMVNARLQGKKIGRFSDVDWEIRDTVYYHFRLCTDYTRRLTARQGCEILKVSKKTFFRHMEIAELKYRLNRLKYILKESKVSVNGIYGYDKNILVLAGNVLLSLYQCFYGHKGLLDDKFKDKSFRENYNDYYSLIEQGFQKGRKEVLPYFVNILYKVDENNINQDTYKQASLLQEEALTGFFSSIIEKNSYPFIELLELQGQIDGNSWNIPVNIKYITNGLFDYFKSEQELEQSMEQYHVGKANTGDVRKQNKVLQETLKTNEEEIKLALLQNVYQQKQREYNRKLEEDRQLQFLQEQQKIVSDKMNQLQQEMKQKNQLIQETEQEQKQREQQLLSELKLLNMTEQNISEKEKEAEELAQEIEQYKQSLIQRQQFLEQLQNQQFHDIDELNTISEQQEEQFQQSQYNSYDNPIQEDNLYTQTSTQYDTPNYDNEKEAEAKATNTGNKQPKANTPIKVIRFGE